MCIFDIKKSNSKFKKKKKITKKNEAKNHRNKARIYFSKGEKIMEIHNIRGILQTEVCADGKFFR